MKVAVSAAGTELNAGIDPRFGRCPYFIIVNTDDMISEASARELQQGQGMGRGLRMGCGRGLNRGMDRRFGMGISTGRTPIPGGPDA